MNLNIFFLLTLSLLVLNTPNPTSIIVSDTLEVRIPSEERLTEISNDARYYYGEEISEPTLWQRFRLWLQQLLVDWLSVSWIEWFLKITAGIAIVCVLLLLINQISKGELKNALIKRQHRTLLDLKVNNSKLSNDKLDSMIESAIENGNFDLAVRYLYQKALVLLRSNDFIKWKLDKTNHEYLVELGSHPSAPFFQRLTYFHDYVDYGDFHIDRPKFQLVENVFNEFANKLTQPK